MTDFDREKIERYLSGQFSTEEQAAFEAELAAHPALALEVALCRDERDLDFALLENHLQSKVRAWNLEPPPAPQRRPWWGWGGLVLVLALGGWLLRGWVFRPAPAPVLPAQPAPVDSIAAPPPVAMRNPAPREQQPALPPAGGGKVAAPRPAFRAAEAAQAAAPRPDSLSEFLVTTLGSHQDIFNEGRQDIFEGRYAEAIGFFQKMEADGRLRENDSGYFLYGYACFRHGDYAGATACFRQIRGMKIGKRRDWMLALSLLAQNGASDPECTQLLRTISRNPAHPFYRQARALKSRIEDQSR